MVDGNSSWHGLGFTYGIIGCKARAENEEGRWETMGPTKGITPKLGKVSLTTGRRLVVGLPWALAVIGVVGFFPVIPTAMAQGGAVESMDDIVIKIVNGTNHEPGFAERVAIFLFGAMQQPLAEGLDVQGEINFGRLLLLPNSQYLIEASVEGVIYHSQATGKQLDDELMTVYVFSHTTDLTGLRATGMNLVIHRGETDLRLEYLFTVVNSEVKLGG